MSTVQHQTLCLQSHISSPNEICLFHGSTEAVEFARTKLTPFGDVQKYVEKLEVSTLFDGIILGIYIQLLDSHFRSNI